MNVRQQVAQLGAALTVSTAAAPHQPAKLLLSIPEAASQLSLGQTVVWKLISTGQLYSVKVGRSRRVPWTALEAFVASLSGAA